MKTMVKLLRELTPEDKLAPQAKAIVDMLVETWGVDVEVERTALIEKLTPEILHTRQEPARILSFYQPRLKELGLVEVIKHESPKEDKPAKEPKAKAEGKKSRGKKEAKEESQAAA